MLFPGGRLPLRIFEQRYLAMAKACLQNGSAFGVCLILDGQEVGQPATPAAIGCVARISEWDMPQLGVLQIVARGEQRFRLLERRVQRDGLALGTIEMLPAESDAPVPASCAACVRLIERIEEQHAGLLERPHQIDSCAWVSARLAELLPLPLATKQALLELGDGRARLEALDKTLRAAS